MSDSLTPEQRWEIQDLHARYVLALDVHDIEAMIALFVPDGVFETFGTTYIGATGLRAMLKHAPHGLHLGGHVVAEPADFGVRARQQLVFIDATDHSMRPAIYDDEIVRFEQQWRFRRRRCQFLTATGTLADRPEN